VSDTLHSRPTSTRKANSRESWHEMEKTRGAVDPFPGLDMRKVDMAAYNDTRETLDKRQLQYYRVLGPMPRVDEDPNLHAAAHLYASDRNGLFPVSGGSSWAKGGED
jgi:hypothetical protein